LQNLNSQHRSKNNGFTLIEILIAISIFTILSLAAYQILQGVLRSGEISKEHDASLVEIQRGMLLIERDFLQMVARASRTSGTETKNLKALYVGKGVLDSDDEGIEFNRLGWTNPLNLLPRSNIVRVGYRVKDKKLQRLYYLYPDTVSGAKAEEQTLLNNIEGLSFRFWNGRWRTTWSTSKSIPDGIEITITSKNYGELRRVFMLPSSTIE